jgi:hypothetical protein
VIREDVVVTAIAKNRLFTEVNASFLPVEERAGGGRV